MKKTEVVAVTIRPHPISNTFHLVMTICTGGLWIPVWIFCARGHKTVTRAPVAAGEPGLSVGEQARGKAWNGERDPEWLAAHVPSSPEYRAAHGG